MLLPYSGEARSSERGIDFSQIRPGTRTGLQSGSQTQLSTQLPRWHISMPCSVPEVWMKEYRMSHVGECGRHSEQGLCFSAFDLALDLVQVLWTAARGPLGGEEPAAVADSGLSLS